MSSKFLFIKMETLNCVLKCKCDMLALRAVWSPKSKINTAETLGTIIQGDGVAWLCKLLCVGKEGL